MKRFTETGKWNDPWFHKLSTVAKVLWGYLCDSCDPAGVIDFDLEIASLHLREKVSESHLKEIGTRIERLPCGKLWIVKFIEFQYGRLSVDCKAHRPVFLAVARAGLEERVLIGYPKGIDTLKETTKDQDRGGAGEIPTLAEWVAECARYSVPEWFAEEKFWSQDKQGWDKIQKWRSCCAQVSRWHANAGRPLEPPSQQSRNGGKPEPYGPPGTKGNPYL